MPLRELSLVVTGDVVLVLHSTGAFDALSGQEWVLPVADILEELESWQGDGAYRPTEWELFDDVGEDSEKGTQRLNQG